MKLDEAVVKYKKEIRSVNDTSDHYIKTWHDFHHAVCWTRFGLADPCPVLPPTPAKIRILGSIFNGVWL